MPNILDKAPCELAGPGEEAGLLPADPFLALQFHFGMLLGVDDLDTLQAYARGKARLHNAWLHREGVVWGFNVILNKRHELEVDPGLAMDAAGHELHLDTKACLDLGQWYEKNKDDPSLTFTNVEGGTGKTFDVHVVARFKGCLTRPVPSIADPCEGAQTDTAYSRAYETVELLLRPGPATQKDRPYRRLRELFQIEDDDTTAYPDVKPRRVKIQALPADQQPKAYLQASREFAALDEIDLGPQKSPAGDRTSIFPEDPTEVVLANVAGIVVEPKGAGGWVLTNPLPILDVTVRPSHVATATIQELLCGPLFTSGTAPGPPPGPGTGPAPAPAPGPAPDADAGGPRIDPANPKLLSKSLNFVTDKPLADASVDVAAFTVTAFDANDGWSGVDLKKASVDANHTKVTLEFKESPAGSRVRLVVRGTGPTPLLGADLVPLAGIKDGPPGTKHDGHDFAFTWERS